MFLISSQSLHQIGHINQLYLGKMSTHSGDIVDTDIRQQGFMAWRHNKPFAKDLLESTDFLPNGLQGCQKGVIPGYPRCR